MTEESTIDHGSGTDSAHPDTSIPSPSRKRNRLIFRVVAVFLAILVTLVLGEGVLRIYVAARGWTPNCYAGSAALLVPDETNGYRMAADFHFRSGIYEITTNNHGLRGPEVDLAKPQDVQRIAILGGSSVFGYLVSDGEVAARLLESRLRADGRRVEVLNGGVPGYNLFQTIERYNGLIARLNPDIVVLYLGWNDLTYVVSDEPVAEQFRRRTPYPAWQRWLSSSTLYGLIAFRLLTPAAEFVPPEASRAEPTQRGAQQFRENLARLINDVRDEGARPVVCAQVMAAHPNASMLARRSLGVTPDEQRRNQRLGEWLVSTLREVAIAESVPFVDASKEIQPTTGVLGDVIHLTPIGELELADLFAAELRPLLETHLGPMPANESGE